MEQTNYDYLLLNWERDIESFLAAAVEVFGVVTDSSAYRLVEANITSIEELRRWIGFFDGNYDSFEQTTEMYLESII